MTTTSANVEHAVLGRDAWNRGAAHPPRTRKKELTRLRDELSAERRALPWLEITEPYEFDGPAGSDEGTTPSLLDLFEGRRQLLIYHFMYGSDWGRRGLPELLVLGRQLQRRDRPPRAP